jgi:TolB-like protein/Tfp pilus assembly protein PilF
VSEPPDIFLSYNREDQATAKRFAEAFEAVGLSVWWDVTLRSGEAYDRVTEEALRTARAVVVLWSPRSVDSRWVRAEASIADENGTLVPAKIEACQLPVMFRLTQTADLSGWRGETKDSAWQAFLGDVRRMVSAVPQRSGRAAPPLESKATGAVPFIAVLPITHRGGDDGLEWLAEDLTEDITRELAQNSFFKVIPAGRVAILRDGAVDHQAAGRQLEARYLLEGRLQRVGEQIRLTMQIIETATGGMLKSARFMRTCTESDLSPEEFAVAVACNLGEQVTQIELNRAMAMEGPKSGWEHAIAAFGLNGRLGPDNQQIGLAEARAAVAVAPDLGLAHAVLAQSCGADFAIGVRDLGEAERQEIHQHIKRAMQLDGDNPAVLYCVASAYAVLGEAEACLRLARRQVELAPYSPLSRFVMGHAWFAAGRPAEAIAEFNEQLRLAPHDLNRSGGFLLLGIMLYVDGQVAEAEEALDRALALNPDYGVALMWKSIAAAHQGREQAARSALLHLREAEPAMTIDQHLRLLVYYPIYRERLAPTVELFRSLWSETRGEE